MDIPSPPVTLVTSREPRSAGPERTCVTVFIGLFIRGSLEAVGDATWAVSWVAQALS
jgi:hypothetical protein